MGVDLFDGDDPRPSCRENVCNMPLKAKKMKLGAKNTPK
jgi:hypothetical protein